MWYGRYQGKEQQAKQATAHSSIVRTLAMQYFETIAQLFLNFCVAMKFYVVVRGSTA
jgi:diketogulonate reductase-like aldo/keto reductase